MQKISKLSQKAIFKCYALMIKHIRYNDVECEDDFCTMLSEIEILKIAIPTDIYAKIENFVYTYIKPLVYDAAASEDENNTMNIQTEEELKEMLASYFKRIWEADKKLQEFGDTELKRYLIN